MSHFRPTSPGFGRTASPSRLLALATLVLAHAGCVLAPEGLDTEAERAAAAGEAWRAPWSERNLPNLPADPTQQDYVRRALLVHGDIEAAWHEWAAAIERVRVESGWPNTNLALDLSLALEGGMSLWERSTIGLGFDPMEMLAQPGKVRQAGRVALHEAHAAGRRFDAARLAVRRRVLQLLAEYALLTERVALQHERLGLLELAQAGAGARVLVGAPQQEGLQALLGRDQAERELLALDAETSRLRAELNALLARSRDALLPLPADELPGALPDDATLLLDAARDNPALAALSSERAARSAALTAARLDYAPDVAPFAQASGGGPEEVGAMVSIPVTLPALRAAVEAARADLRAGDAALRQAHLDTEASFVAALAALRAAELQASRLDDRVLPAARQLGRNDEEAYVTGGLDLAELVESRLLLLEAREARAEARTARAMRLAELEELAGRELTEPTIGGSP